MKTKKITVSRGVFNIRYGGNEDGFPVLMLHGWPESSYRWEGVAAHLNPSLRIIAPDLRGLGDSERTLGTKAYQKVELAKDIAEIMDAFQIDTFLHVGHLKVHELREQTLERAVLYVTDPIKFKDIVSAQEE